ncbi:MAG TPA: hypothetical protein PKM43_23095 [Verrucomicrobiota bacterium]|nr:hypothetical protein [Verrucomicrobiota bacterium]HRZ54456.1 hypothetical protein [Candidatus Paceibacterota bacterium]
MAGTPEKRICRNCGELFIPNWRNRHRQWFCQKPECRKASKASSHESWLKDNPKYFHGYEHAERIQGWREANPERARSQRAKAKKAHPNRADRLDNQAPTSAQGHLSESSEGGSLEPGVVLQDFIMRNPLMLGLIGRVCGCVLQDDFEKAVSQLLSEGAEAQRRMRVEGLRGNAYES